MNQNKALWCLFLTCITTIIICFLVGFVIAIVEYHSKNNVHLNILKNVSV